MKRKKHRKTMIHWKTASSSTLSYSWCLHFSFSKPMNLWMSTLRDVDSKRSKSSLKWRKNVLENFEVRKPDEAPSKIVGPKWPKVGYLQMILNSTFHWGGCLSNSFLWGTCTTILQNFMGPDDPIWWMMNMIFIGCSCRWRFSTSFIQTGPFLQSRYESLNRVGTLYI